MDVMALAQQCAPAVHPTTMAAVMKVESGFNPFAIGVVGGRLARQPANKAEAVATAKALEEAGYNFSLGAAQVNRHNLSRFNLNYETAFDPCESIRAGGGILKECFERAKGRFPDEQHALQASFSCYYSGNFTTGFRQDFVGQPSYVQKVLNNAVVSSGAAAPTAVAIPVIRSATGKSASGKPSAVAVGALKPGGADASDATGVISTSEATQAGDAVMVFQ